MPVQKTKTGLNIKASEMLGAPQQKTTTGLPENNADFETGSGRPKENKATTTKNKCRKMKAKMFLSFDYKNLWNIFAENLSEKEFCKIWSSLTDNARKLSQDFTRES